MNVVDLSQVPLGDLQSELRRRGPEMKAHRMSELASDIVERVNEWRGDVEDSHDDAARSLENNLKTLRPCIVEVRALARDIWDSLRERHDALKDGE